MVYKTVFYFCHILLQSSVLPSISLPSAVLPSSSRLLNILIEFLQSPSLVLSLKSALSMTHFKLFASARAEMILLILSTTSFSIS